MNVVTGISSVLCIALALITMPVSAQTSDAHFNPIQFKSKKLARW